jgi:hypothetical protein
MEGFLGDAEVIKAAGPEVGARQAGAYPQGSAAEILP